METYIHYLSRFSLYTRTRAEYEKNVLRLSPDQCNAIDRISLKKELDSLNSENTFLSSQIERNNFV